MTRELRFDEKPVSCVVCGVVGRSDRVWCAPCGGLRHDVCAACYARWQLGPLEDGEMPPFASETVLEVCPLSDEFKVATVVMLEREKEPKAGPWAGLFPGRDQTEPDPGTKVEGL